MTPTDARREYRTGSVYQRSSDGMWIATIEAGWTAKGTRRRFTVSAKTEAAVKRKLRDKKDALARGEATSSRATVKSWAAEYLAMRVHDLSPKGYNAAANPIKNWVVPTIGHKRLDTLTPADIRKVADAQREHGRQAGDTHRAMLTMLRAAIVEGHQVPHRVLLVKAPAPEKSDRLGMSVPEGLAVLEQASALPHGTRWLITMLYGSRQGECLGATWDALDFDGGAYGELVVEWQLQALPYVRPRDRSSGFRVPDGHEARHLVDAWHLVRPKSKQGYRVLPLLEPVRDALLAWRDIAPANPWGLIWPSTNGRPANTKYDLAEWHALQGAASVVGDGPRVDLAPVVVGHPEGRYYHVHECRNFAATMLDEAGVDEHVITSLLGHSSVVMSRKYMNVRREPLLEGMRRVGERLQLGGG